MDENKKKEIVKLINLKDEPALVIFEELQSIGKTLETIANKEMPEIPPFPEIPEQKEPDMTETNTLLKQLLEKEAKPVEISVELQIE